MFPILYPLKTPENQRFPDIFRGYKLGTVARNELLKTKFKHFLAPHCTVSKNVVQVSLGIINLVGTENFCKN